MRSDCYRTRWSGAKNGELRAVTSSYLKHHWRFYASVALGILVWVSTGMLARPLHVTVAGDAFFGAISCQCSIRWYVQRPQICGARSV